MNNIHQQAIEYLHSFENSGIKSEQLYAEGALFPRPGIKSAAPVMRAGVKGEPRYRIEIAEIMRQVKLLEKDLQTFVLGGGVAQHPGFHQAVRCKVRQLNHGYVQSPLLQAGLERYILPPALGNRSGAIALAAESSPIARN